MQVTIIDNPTSDPPNKTVVLKMQNATPGGSTIKTPTTTLTIIDNEGPGTIDFSSNAYTVVESGGFATATVNRVGASNLRVSVQYATQAPLANPATAVTDYTPITPAQTLIFEPIQRRVEGRHVITERALRSLADQSADFIAMPRTVFDK